MTGNKETIKTEEQKCPLVGMQVKKMEIAATYLSCMLIDVKRDQKNALLHLKTEETDTFSLPCLEACLLWMYLYPSTVRMPRANVLLLLSACHSVG